MQPNVVAEGEPNKIWMIAAGLRDDVGLSDKDFLLKLAKTTAYFVEPAKSSDRLRMVTRNPSLMRTFSALWPLVHFNPPTVLPVRVDLLNTIAGLTDAVSSAFSFLFDALNFTRYSTLLFNRAYCSSISLLRLPWGMLCPKRVTRCSRILKNPNTLRASSINSLPGSVHRQIGPHLELNSWRPWTLRFASV